MRRLFLGLCMALIFGLSVSAPRVAAQDDKFALAIAAINCSSPPGSNEDPFFNDLPDCVPNPNIAFVVTDASTGAVIGSCVTVFHNVPPDSHTPQGCGVFVDYAATVIVTEDTSTVPVGYLPVENPISITAPDVPGHGVSPEANFLNVLQAASPGGDDSSPQLPSTGTGTTANPFFRLVALFR
jgi:hypothetical protein